MEDIERLDAPNILCKAYFHSWFTECHARYIVLKGGRNTGKSHNIFGLEPIFKILDNPIRNIIMLRANDVDNANSTYSNLVEKIDSLELTDLFKCTKSPLKITYRPTGQVIIFRGCNNPTSLTSIKPETGMFTDIYFEEAFEIKSYEDFRKIDGSIRGVTPPGVYLQIHFAFNAWNVDSWLYEVFFKGRLEDNVNELEIKGFQEYYDPNFDLGFGKGLYLHTSSYKCNEYRTADYDNSMLELKEKAYELYKVEGLGCFGCTTGKVYECWNDKLIIPPHIANKMHITRFAIGIDTAYSDGQGKPIKQEGFEIGSAMTMQLVGMVDNNKIVCINEYFHTNIGAKVRKTSVDYQNELIDTLFKWREIYDFMKMGFTVFVDCADIGFRQSLEDMAKKRGLYNARFVGSTKLPIHNRILVENHLMAFGELLVSENCPNLVREIKACHQGTKGEPRADTNDHAINAFEYGLAPLQTGLLRWKEMKMPR